MPRPEDATWDPPQPFATPLGQGGTRGDGAGLTNVTRLHGQRKFGNYCFKTPTPEVGLP